MPNQPSEVMLKIDAGPEADSEEVEKLRTQLQHEILEVDVEAVDLVRTGEAPVDAKGDAIALGVLAITLAPVVLKGLINILQSWLTRHERCSVTLEKNGEKVTLTGSPSEEQQRMIDAWLRSERQS